MVDLSFIPSGDSLGTLNIIRIPFTFNSLSWESSYILGIQDYVFEADINILVPFDNGINISFGVQSNSTLFISPSDVVANSVFNLKKYFTAENTLGVSEKALLTISGVSSQGQGVAILFFGRTYS